MTHTLDDLGRAGGNKMIALTSQQKIHIGTSPLTGTIFAGSILKHGTWAAGKQDVTDEALFAVALHCLHFGSPVEIVNSSGSGFRITAEPLK